MGILQAKRALESELDKQLYGQRKIDVESVLGCMKCNFGVCRVHVRGKLSIYNDVELLLMGMNLTKLANKLFKGEMDFLFNFYILSYYIRKSRIYHFWVVNLAFLGYFFSAVFCLCYFNTLI